MSCFGCYYKWSLKNSTSNCLMLVYRNTVNFLILTLYLKTFLNLLVSFKRFFVVVLFFGKFLRGFYVSCVRKESFTSFFKNFF